MNDVKVRWTLITGASRGIGYEIAAFMAKRGSNLVLHSRNKEHTEKILQEVIALGVEATLLKPNYPICLTIAPAVICYRLIPKMIDKGFGRVINTTIGIRNEPEQGAYSVSKAASCPEIYRHAAERCRQKSIFNAIT